MKRHNVYLGLTPPTDDNEWLDGNVIDEELMYEYIRVFVDLLHDCVRERRQLLNHKSGSKMHNIVQKSQSQSQGNKLLHNFQHFRYNCDESMGKRVFNEDVRKESDEWWWYRGRNGVTVESGTNGGNYKWME
jgi:hypothetical protein